MSIVLIIKKVHPAYSLILGALLGGIVCAIATGNAKSIVPYMEFGLVSTVVAVIWYVI